MERYKEVRKASIFGIIGNIFLCIIKGITGFMTNSQSMIADAFNSAGDIFSSIMTFIGNKIASKPQDDDHNLGHGKAEYIYSMLISITLFLMTYSMFKKSFLSLINKSIYKFSPFLIIVCLITIIIKLALYFYTKNIATKYNNLLIDANSKDHRNDCVITALNLLACILSLYNIHYIDGIVGMIISIWIFSTAIKIFMESYDVLMDKSISNKTKSKVLQLVKKHQEIEKIIHFNSTPVGYRYQISFTIYVDGNLTTFESHKIANDLEEEISHKIPEIYLTVIHVNPIEKGE